MKASELVDRIVMTLDAYGWRQGGYGNRKTGFCVVGAARHCLGPGGNQQPLFWKLGMAVGHLSLIHWNDAPGRTKREVLYALTKAGAKLRERGE